MDPERLRQCDFSRVLAVVSANLYGLPNDLAAIESICRERGVYFLDDAAQALGASLENRPVGTFGDAGLYSFDKGKIISTIQGGAIFCRTGSLVAQLESAVGTLPESTLPERAGNFLKLAIYSVFLRPTLYPLVRLLPFTGLGHTVYEPRYPITRLSRFASAVAVRLLARLDELGAVRRRNAANLHQALDGMSGIEAVQPLPGAIAAYARFPVRVRDPAMRSGVIAALDRAGIGATASYPLSLADVPEVRVKLPAEDIKCAAARRIAATVLTLPTHAYCPPDLADRVQKVIHACTS
jgi:dTDP-4-amino-4,6-dideoxygalactose transaminase